MPLWPFGRKKQRTSSAQQIAEQDKLTAKPAYDPNYPQNATPRPVEARKPDDGPRKRRRSGEQKDLAGDRDEKIEDYEKQREPRSRSSREDITALPGARKLERSPHLRSATMHNPVIPYNSSPVPASRKAMVQEQGSPRPRGKQPSRNPSSPANQKRRLSRKQEHHDRALREEEIRAMSAPVSIPKRSEGHGDMQKRDSKKARRFSRPGHDSRGSNVSLPFQGSIHSSMSGVSDKRGWEIAGLDFLNPRPTVRISGSRSQLGNHSGALGLSRDGSKKGKLSAVKEDANKKDRRKIAELADDLDSSDIRALMERDTRRREKKRSSDKDQLERSLRKRAEKQQIEDERRARDMGTPTPSSIHPAFRTGKQKEVMPSDSNVGDAPLTPTSIQGEEGRFHAPMQITAQKQPEPEKNPFDDPEGSPFADPVEVERPANRIEKRGRLPTPIDIPSSDAAQDESFTEDPVLETARAVRLSQSRMSGISQSPPQSPVYANHAGNLSPLRREYTPDIPEHKQLDPIPIPEKQAETPTADPPKRTGTWAQFFRRGTPTRATDEQRSSAPEPSSFSNTSRESMSRQPLPAHLVGTMSKRRSGTPARTQSIFREDLPETPASQRDSRHNSADAALIAMSRKPRQGGGGSTSSHPHVRGATPDLGPGRTDSPVDTEGRNSAIAMSTSLASIDSEGSWLTGRPSKRRSGQSGLRSETGSLSKRREDSTASYEDLGIAEDEFFRRLTPNPETSRQADNTEAGAVESEESELVRRDTSRRRPTLIQRDPRFKSREGLVSDYLETPTLEEDPIESTTQSEVESLAEIDRFEQEAIEYGRGHKRQMSSGNRFEHQAVEYGRGHARQMSSGSAKLLDIPPSRTRSGRNSPDTRQSQISTSDYGDRDPPTPRL